MSCMSRIPFYYCNMLELYWNCSSSNLFCLQTIGRSCKGFKAANVRTRGRRKLNELVPYDLLIGAGAVIIVRVHADCTRLWMRLYSYHINST